MRYSRQSITLLAVTALAIIVACGVELPTPITDHGSPYFSDLESAKLVATSNQKPILVDFYTDW